MILIQKEKTHLGAVDVKWIWSKILTEFKH